ncbi:MAG: hypothetical protein K8T91_09885 [Planctomycetes bacterium]|nr:hypothetical protein [Planctomycetota bacterium]
MSTLRTRSDVIDREFLEIRAGILQVAAALDRIDRAAGPVSEDPRLVQLRVGLELLLCEGDDRAERVELAFSRPFDEAWRTTLKVPAP